MWKPCNGLNSKIQDQTWCNHKLMHDTVLVKTRRWKHINKKTSLYIESICFVHFYFAELEFKVLALKCTLVILWSSFFSQKSAANEPCCSKLCMHNSAQHQTWKHSTFLTLLKLICKHILITQRNVCNHAYERGFILDLASKFQKRNVLEAEDPNCTLNIPWKRLLYW